MKKLGWMFAASLLMGGVALADQPPEGPPPGGHHRPPEAAFTACANLTEGAACTVEFHEHKMEGSCAKVPAQFTEDAGKLVCHPAHPPHPPRE